MLKRILLILFMFLISPAFAGVLENAMKDNNYVLLYLYSHNCGYCHKFNPKFEKASKSYSKKCKFVKIDAESGYGYNLMRKYRAYYVPYVVLIDSKTNKNKQILGECLLSSVCFDKAVMDFTKK